MGETPPSYQINFSSLCAHLYFVLLTIQYIPHKETEVSGNMHTSWTLCVLNTYKNYVKWLMKSCVKKTVYHYIQYSLFKGAGIPKIFLKICTMVFETFSPNYQQCCRKYSMERFKKNCLETVRSFFIQHMAKLFISKGLKFQK